MKNLLIAVRLFLWMTLLTGVAYPLLVTMIAQTTLRKQAEGNCVVYQEKMVGSLLIGQKFESEKYFWPRPSAINYKPLPSGGSNLGPTSKRLQEEVEKRKAHLSKFHQVSADMIPSELLYASGSGIDPHISPEAALFQIDRIVKARQLDAQSGRERIIQLISKLVERKGTRIFELPQVNVLALNIALDEIK